MTGVEDLEFRIPETWDPDWFSRVFIKDILRFADARNIEGDGITITGDPSEPATATVDSVSLSGLDDIAENTFLGRVSAGTGEVENLNTAQTTALIDLATGANKGVVLRAGAVTDADSSTVSTGAADASDLATVITLANELKADLAQAVSDLNDTVTQLNAKLAADIAAGQQLP